MFGHFVNPVDRANPTPLWAQVLDDLRGRLARGELDERFPTEHELMAAYGVSRQTVRDAVRRLSDAGLVERTRGRGTRVRRFEHSGGSLESLYEQVRAHGATQRSVVRVRDVVRDRAIAGRLGLRSTAALVHIERLRLADDEPLALDRAWLPKAVAGALLRADLSETSLFAELARTAGVELDAATERITPCVPDAIDRRALRLPAGEAAFSIERLASVGARAVEWRHSLVRGDRYAITFASSRGAPAPAAVPWALAPDDRLSRRRRPTTADPATSRTRPAASAAQARRPAVPADIRSRVANDLVQASGPDHDVIVVGAGFSGIGAAIALGEAGIHDVAVLEAGDGVGGAWHWNTYPGVAVDIPSFSYQFSFRQRAGWSRVYAPGRELKAYAEQCVDRYGIRDRIRLNTTVTDATFDDEQHCWRLGTASGEELTARHVIGATGVLTKPKPPEIAGVERFAGTTVHTARWDHALDLRGRRVAVIGTGASAVQLIPAIAPDVSHLTVFQRTPVWCLPKPDAPLPAPVRAALRWIPGAQAVSRLAAQTYVELTFPVAAHFATVVPVAKAAERMGRSFLRRQVHDPATRDKLTPRYGLGCKRPTFHNTYLSTFNRSNVALETTPIAEITEAGVRTADGVEHAVDVLVLATGFKVFEPGNMPPYPIRGRGGRDLDAFWAEHRYQAYEGVSVPGFPNLFTILGPYGYNGASYFTLIENQMRHIVRCLTHARERGATRVEVTEAANARYFERMLGRRGRQVFFQGTCSTANSYYFDSRGDVPFRPSTTLEAAWRAGHYDLDDYRFDALDAEPAPVVAAA